MNRLRFGVGDPSGKHSSIWVMTHNKNDVYLGSRNLMGRIKISFHESGIARVALTHQYQEKLHNAGRSALEDRKMCRWQMPDVPEDGAILVARLVFPTAFLNSQAYEPNLKKQVVFIMPAPDTQAVEFGIFYSKEHPSTLEEKLLKVSTPMFFITLPNGQYVSLVSRYTNFDAETAKKQFIQKTAKASFVDLSLEEIKDTETYDNLSAFLWNVPEEHEQGILELWDVHGISLTRKTSA